MGGWALVWRGRSYCWVWPKLGLWLWGVVKKKTMHVVWWARLECSRLQCWEGSLRRVACWWGHELRVLHAQRTPSARRQRAAAGGARQPQRAASQRRPQGQPPQLLAVSLGHRPAPAAVSAAAGQGTASALDGAAAAVSVEASVPAVGQGSAPALTKRPCGGQAGGCMVGWVGRRRCVCTAERINRPSLLQADAAAQRSAGRA